MSRAVFPAVEPGTPHTCVTSDLTEHSHRVDRPYLMSTGWRSALGSTELRFAAKPPDASEVEPMRTIKRLVLLAVMAYGGVLAFNYWSDGSWPSVPRAAALDTRNAKEQAARVADRATAVVTKAAHRTGDQLQEGGLTAKIKAKMALDDHVNARAIDVDSADSVVTLTGVVASEDQRQRALRLAKDTEGVTRVVDKLQIKP
jgi:hypothetical protein